MQAVAVCSSLTLHFLNPNLSNKSLTERTHVDLFSGLCPKGARTVHRSRLHKFRLPNPLRKNPADPTNSVSV